LQSIPHHSAQSHQEATTLYSANSNIFLAASQLPILTQLNAVNFTLLCLAVSKLSCLTHIVLTHCGKAFHFYVAERSYSHSAVLSSIKNPQLHALPCLTAAKLSICTRLNAVKFTLQYLAATKICYPSASVIRILPHRCEAFHLYAAERD